MSFDDEILERLKKLQGKYATIGQDMNSYLDGLLYSNVTAYWDYLNLDALLNLQHPKTDFPDENIFIIYHQITELYFKLALNEMEQIAFNGRNIVMESGEDRGWNDELKVELFIDRVRRINQYFEALTKSFDIMVLGMESEQFLRFRMALLPASGFQSAQYRKIEICATDMIRLVHKDKRDEMTAKNASIEEMTEHFYWKEGAMELASGKKTLTLKHFEKKYGEDLLELAEKYEDKNLWAKYKALSEEDQRNPDLIRELRQLDINVNVNWPLVHYKSAVRYLHKPGEDTAATGGTNWQKYLPPRFQKRIFYPTLWSEQEMEEWGKAWVEKLTQ